MISAQANSNWQAVAIDQDQQVRNNMVVTLACDLLVATYFWQAVPANLANDPVTTQSNISDLLRVLNNGTSERSALASYSDLRSNSWLDCSRLQFTLTKEDEDLLTRHCFGKVLGTKYEGDIRQLLDKLRKSFERAPSPPLLSLLRTWMSCLVLLMGIARRKEGSSFKALAKEVGGQTIRGWALSVLSTQPLGELYQQLRSLHDKCERALAEKENAS
ncbi:MAG: hypothetical protein P1V97_27170 [Planctomycetota bacterium]|nr:hypothetical protein [Planctomycetota bacterium]